MSEYESAGAGGQGGAEIAHVDASDRVLRADGHDVRTGHLVVAVHEEGREVLAVGERDEAHAARGRSCVESVRAVSARRRGRRDCTRRTS